MYTGPYPNRNWKEAQIHVNFEPDTTNMITKERRDDYGWGTIQAHQRIVAVSNTDYLIP